MFDVIHIASSATRALCDEPITGRNVDPWRATCVRCQEVFEANMWDEVNAAKQEGNAGRADSARDYIAKLRRHWAAEVQKRMGF